MSHKRRYGKGGSRKRSLELGLFLSVVMQGPGDSRCCFRQRVSVNSWTADVQVAVFALHGWSFLMLLTDYEMRREHLSHLSLSLSRVPCVCLALHCRMNTRTLIPYKDFVNIWKDGLMTARTINWLHRPSVWPNVIALTTIPRGPSGAGTTPDTAWNQRTGRIASLHPVTPLFSHGRFSCH